mmetsp:Transcript_40731/g.75716  ORF Transcript_40731/g.75716 Transcript_40731/m.75716 type:complete len:571 (-) Transcript_40731:66-1778(-)
MGSPRRGKHWQRARSLAQLNILCQRMSAHPSEGSGDEKYRLHDHLGLQDSELPPELESLSRLSNAQLRAAVEEAQERSAKNRNFLLEAGERGQELLQEEAALECRLEECHEELADNAHGRHDPEGGAEWAGHAEWPPSLGVGGGPEWALSTSSSSTAVRHARKQLHWQQAEMQRIREQNELLEEELEEREQAIKRRADAAHSRRRTGASKQSEQERNNQEVFQHVSVLTSEVAEASASVGHVSDTCNRERAELERELAEVQRQTSSMRSVLERHIEAAQERNAEMQTELQSARALRVERSLPLRNAINGLRQELQDARSTSEEAEKELNEARREVATAEAEAEQRQTLRPTAKSLEGLAVTLQLPTSALDASLRHSSDTSSSEESDVSEYWDGHADAVSDIDARSQSLADGASQASERDRDSVSSGASQLGLRHKSQRREALKQRRNGYNPVEVVVNAKEGASSTATAATAEAAATAAAAAASAASAASEWGSWGYHVGASVLGDALLKFDQYVAQEDQKRDGISKKRDSGVKQDKGSKQKKDSGVKQDKTDKKKKKEASASGGSKGKKL